MSELRRIAIVDHMSAGGVSRFLLALITHMAAQHPGMEITYFVSGTNIARDDLEARLRAFPNVTLQALAPSPTAPTADAAAGRFGRLKSALRALPGVLLAAKWVCHRLRPSLPQALDWWQYRLPNDTVARLAPFDVVYVGWPFYCEPFQTPTPVVATFHDFHFRHFPGSYNPQQLALLERQTRGWLASCTTAITSTRFIHDELHSFFGDVVPRSEIVYLAPYAFLRPSADAVAETLDRLGVRRPYALFSGGRSRHKNIAAVIEAIGILKRQGVRVHLAVTGLGTDGIGVDGVIDPSDPLFEMNRLARDYSLVRGEDFFALGYVSNADVDALTAGADVVVSASLYEAGCGPAMDAWQAGVPVAFSNTPPFLEQIERFGPEAWVFDPHDPADVADKIRSAVFDVPAARAMAERSVSAFSAYTWDDVGREYYRILAEAAARCVHSEPDDVGAHGTSNPGPVDGKES